jgi:competence protein ComFC
MIDCFICRRELATSGLCNSCWSNLTWKGKKLSHNWIYSLFIYEKSALDLIHLFKYKSPWLWIKLLVNWFRLLYSDLIASFDFLIPIAMHRRKLAKRGYNQVLLLTRALAKAFKKPYYINNLVKVFNTKSQTLLTRKERLENVKDTFFLKKPQLFYNKKILILDDVVTTGATLTEAKRALLTATDQIIGLTIASSKDDLAS